MSRVFEVPVARAPAGSPPAGGAVVRAREAAGSPTVEELALAAQGGSLDAFEALVRRTSEALVSFLRVRARSAEDAEELAQEAFLRAWRNLARYDARWRFRTWLFTIAQRLLVSRYRRAELPVVDEPPEVAGQARDPSREAGRREERENLWTTARRVLSPEQQSALWLRYAEDLPAKEVARVLGKREVTVRVILHRARERLAPHLDARPAAPEDPR